MTYLKNNFKLRGEIGIGDLRYHKQQEKRSYFTQDGRRRE